MTTGPEGWFMVAAPAAQLAASLRPRARLGRWTASSLAAVLSLALALAAAASALLHGAGAGPQAGPVSWVGHSPLHHAVLILICFLGTIVVGFSRRYLAGESGQAAYLRWLHLTLAMVMTAVISDHTLVLLAAWVGISLCLHRLLMFYPERPRAALAAHKKFIFARLAELSLLAAFLLLHEARGTWLVSGMGLSGLKPDLMTQLAALGIALAALIKCAQLPLHGWLIQVVESPTPVSALLHAGIVNLGGYLLILFAPLLAVSPAAQWLVLVVAGLTTVLSSLIMTTRVSIKVRLAWSTSAQMGLMLLECALGFFQLALLHLLAHSCYKACAFLGSGAEVEMNLDRRLAPPAFAPARAWISAIALSGLLLAFAHSLGVPLASAPGCLLLATLGFLLAERYGKGVTGRLDAALGIGALLVGMYSAEKHLAALLTGPIAIGGALPQVWVASLFLLLAILHWLLRYRSSNPGIRALALYLYAGLYLDEWVTRLTLLIWPNRLPPRASPKRLIHVHEET